MDEDKMNKIWNCMMIAIVLAVVAFVLYAGMRGLSGDFQNAMAPKPPAASQSAESAK